jgi:hypothetical protein
MRRMGVVAAVLVVVGTIAFIGGLAGAKTKSPLTTPTGVTVTPGVGAVTVSWSPEADKPVTYSVISNPTGLACSVNNKTSCSIPDRVSTPYSFTVTASNKKLGISPSSLPTPALNPHLVLVVAGQSNASGVESFNPDPNTGINYLAAPYTNGADANDLITWEPWFVAQGMGATPVPLDTPQQITVYSPDILTIFGPEIGLARQLWTDTGRSLTIVKAAYEGTDLAVNWAPRGTGTPPDGLFPAMVSQVDTVMANDAANGQFDVLGGFYWYQGESDAGQESLAKEYQKNLNKFILALRKDLPMTPTAPIVLAKEDITANIAYELSQGAITPADAAIETTGNSEVRAADDWAAANLPDVVEVDTADLARNGPTGALPGTEIHLTNVSELTLGQELATASEALLP